MKKATVYFSLKDMAHEDSPERLEGCVEITDQGIFIRLAGHADKVTPADQSQPIMVEFHNGQARVVVWSDITEEDPTHSISMEGAREEKRESFDGYREYR